MEQTITREQGVSTTQYGATVTSAPTLRGTRTIDGFFRARTSTKPRMADAPVVKDSIAFLAAQRQNAPGSAPEIRDVMRPAHKPRKPSAARGVNHTRAHTPQAAKGRNITISHATVKGQKLDVRRGEPNHVRHHAAQRSRTLRRDAVPTPEQTTHNLLKPQSALQRETPSLIAAKHSAAAIDTDRLVRAQSTPKNSLVAHHGAAGAPGLSPTFAPVAVQPIPSPQPGIPGPTNPGNNGEPVLSPKPSNKPADLYEHALANASGFVDLHAHKAAYRHKARLHIANMLAGSLVLIAVAGVVAWQNSPALQLKVASLRAGVGTHMPNFAAAGFSYNGVRAGNNRLTFGLKQQQNTYQLTQSNTNMNDVDMIQAIGSTRASGTPAYQVVLAGNTVVYRFDNTTATWVSNGKWYTLSGSDALSDSQVKAVVQHT